MGEVIRISISFPLPVTLSDVAHQTLHDALELICAYTVRLTRKWLEDVGPPHCPDHGEMICA